MKESSYSSSELILSRGPNAIERRLDSIKQQVEESVLITLVNKERTEAKKRNGRALKRKERRYLSGYSIFLSERSKYVKKLYPDIPYTNAMRLIEKQWKNLPRKSREHYFLIAENRWKERTDTDDNEAEVMNEIVVPKKLKQRKGREIPKFCAYYEYLKKWKTVDTASKLSFQKEATTLKDEYYKKFLGDGAVEQTVVETKMEPFLENGNAQIDPDNAFPTQFDNLVFNISNEEHELPAPTFTDVGSTNNFRIGFEDICTTFKDTFSTYNDTRNMEIENLSHTAAEAKHKNFMLLQQVGASHLKIENLKAELNLSKNHGEHMFQVHYDLVNVLSPSCHSTEGKY